MLHLLGLRVGASLIRPVLWGAGGLAVLLLAGGGGVSQLAAAGAAVPVAHARITQPFGCTSVAIEPFDARCASGHFHSGVDLAAPPGTPVYSVCAGVAATIVSQTGYGIHVLVDCGAGVQMLYGHLQRSALSAAAAAVAAGSLLGWVGSTGLSTGPHLHYEVRRAGVAVDPMPWLPEYGGTTLRREQKW